LEARDIVCNNEDIFEFRLDCPRPSGLRAGIIVGIERDTSSMRYYLMMDLMRYPIQSGGTAHIADLASSARSGSAALIVVLEVDDTLVTVRVCQFASLFTFDATQRLCIKVSDSTMGMLPEHGRAQPVHFLTQEFLFQSNTLFVIGVGPRESGHPNREFALVSKKYQLNISRESDEYVTDKLSRKKTAHYSPIYILRGPIVFIDHTQQSRIAAEVAARIDSINNPDSYFAAWEAYQKLEELYLQDQAQEFGVFQYSSYTTEVKETMIYKFVLCGTGRDISPEAGIDIDCTSDETIQTAGVLKKPDLRARIKFEHVGRFFRMDQDNIFCVMDRFGAARKTFPPKGYLIKSIIGDKIRLKRRESAKKAIITEQAPIHHLALLIDNGISSIKQYRDEQAITNSLLENYNLSKDFTPKQNEALKIALNTPDIALIQGPPGTGKTALIRALVYRFEEAFQKRNHGKKPEILVTSYQHDAVENVIAGMEPNGVPVKKIGGRRDEQSSSRKNIDEWILKTIQACEVMAQGCEIPAIYNDINAIEDSIFAWRTQHRDLSQGIILVKKLIDKHYSEVSHELALHAERACSSGPHCERRTEAQLFTKIEREEFRKILDQQRLTPLAYDDDGLRKIFDLKIALQSGAAKVDKEPECLQAVIENGAADIEHFTQYVDFVEQLKKQFTPEPTIEVRDDVQMEEIDTCLTKLIKELHQKLTRKLENREEAMAQALYEYIDKLRIPSAVDAIIENYSTICAATCQQAMEWSKGVSATTYDLVIIDEAARANPLDLFIPLSMGAQVILVGDQKQLPHVLEPEIIRLLDQENNLTQQSILDKSLFERLFDNLEAQHQLGQVWRTYRLTEQYRMIPEINDFVSEAFYDNTLRCGLPEDKINERRIELPIYQGKALVWIEISKTTYGYETGGASKSRMAEAEVIVEHCRQVRNHSLSATIGIITFYARQKELITEKAQNYFTKDELEKISIGTVDAFQGKEFDVVFLSCVRANNVPAEDRRMKIGFLDRPNRLCVALSRAKSLLVVVGDRGTMHLVESLNNFISRCERGEGVYIHG